MCGIAAEFGPEASLRGVERMLFALAHRGPDAAGAKAIARLGVGGMCRLRIRGEDMALPAEGAGGLLISYNGEIYRDHAAGLGGIPQGLRGETVSLARAMIDGSALDGMFAGVVIDQARAEAFVVRDPSGIKPLYMHCEAGCLALASEIPALLAGRAGAAIRRAAIHDFLAIGRVSGSGTFFENLQLVPRGRWLRIEEGAGAAPRLVEVGALSPLPEASLSLAETLNSAILSATTSDSPIALAISGGIDSALLADALAKEGHTDIATFSVTTGTPGDHCARLEDEGLSGQSWRSWSHHVVEVTPAAYYANLRYYIRASGQPTRMSSAPLYMAMGQAVARAGRRVLLSGEGADELFFGYNSYADLLPFADSHGAPAILHQLARYYLSDERRRLVGWLIGADHLNGAEQRIRTDLADRIGDSFSQSLRSAEAEYRLQPLLERTDVALMAASVEGRVPFLHGGMPAIANRYTLPDCIVDGQTKRPLRAIAPDHLRAAMRKKANFRAPLAAWQGSSLVDQFMQARKGLAPVFADLGIQEQGVERIIELARRGQSAVVSELLFCLLSLSLWLRDLGYGAQVDCDAALCQPPFFEAAR